MVTIVPVWSTYARSLAYQAAAENKTRVPRISTAAALVGHEGHILGLRSADGDRNSALIANITMVIRTALRGPALVLADDDDANAAWRAWSQMAGYRHQFGTFPQVVAIALQNLLRDGGAIIQRIQVEPDAWHPNGFSLLVRPWKNIDKSQGDQGFVYAQGAHLAGVHFRQFQHALGFSVRDGMIDRQFVDVRDLVVLRLNYEADGLAGQPHTRACLTEDKVMREMSLAELRAAHTAANVSVFGHTTQKRINGPSQMFNAGHTTFEGPNGQSIDRLAPGSMVAVYGVEGLEIPRSDHNAVQYKTHMAMVAAGAGLTLQLVGGDTGEASMSSLLHSTQLQERTTDSLAQDAGIGVLFAKVLKWFIVGELLTGRNWAEQNWQWLPAKPIVLDPRKNVEAMKIAVEQGFASRPMQIRSQGNDPRAVDREIEADTFQVSTQQRPMAPTAEDVADEVEDRIVRIVAA